MNTQVLALVLENAYGRPSPELLQEKLWKPMGMEFDASWNLDSKEHETVKAFCCINARARLHFAASDVTPCLDRAVDVCVC